ncbi:Hydroxymethylpyrimidine/phosphomethylpyrimidine kinase [wastewater metagenome]|uniref:Hydroxymethylpyrimidine/phosphomethylpyrimidine kinase n=2 Tax=unclassified sequences TaxID=12908 RepID=A0A5B8REI5_9ZZZZ|nr:bifunctional hydroxymethylpyrimidine kinase/phosphomethylpyrimidine kinase [Arhodomonas sp. KWT]QEA05167.1 hydroxymethylpyrimidine/phosphomethylpyrimidine kinase [uncultured organism]
MTHARVLIVAGSDSGGGAGIQADIKAVTALRGYAMTAITALTAQNTLGVQDVFPIPSAFIAEQMRSVLGDIGADCIKTGMLHDAPVIETVAEMLESMAPAVPLVVDPVMVAQSGDRLLQTAAVEALRTRLVPRASLVTPNIPEAEVLLERRIHDEADQIAAAEALLALGCGAVLVKGGHAAGETITDVLATPTGTECLRQPRIATECTHGTGCTLASAIAAGVARGMDLAAAVARARRYLQRALVTATPLGGGHGPVNHIHTVSEFDGNSA